MPGQAWQIKVGRTKDAPSQRTSRGHDVTGLGILRGGAFVITPLWRIFAKYAGSRHADDSPAPFTG